MKPRPQHIGIVAHSAEGAALCYRAMCHEGFRRMGPHQHPEITMSSIPMGRSMEAWERGAFDSIGPVLLEGVDRVAAAGADFFVIPDNTAHLALATIRDSLPIPALEIVEVVCDRAEEAGFTMVGVLGTRQTMCGPLYGPAAASRGIRCLTPSDVEQSEIHRIIFEELVNGHLTERARSSMLSAIDNLRERGCEAAVLACTEIPLLLEQRDATIPLLDSTRLLARAAVTRALSDVPAADAGASGGGG